MADDTNTEETSDLRADIEAAVQEVESEFEGSQNDDARQEAEPAAEIAPVEAAEATETGESTDDAQSGSDADTESATEPSESLSEYEAEDLERYPGLTAERIKTAPEGWRPLAREGFGNLPEHVRREIHRRETDIGAGLTETAQARETYERVNSIFAPYRAILDQEGAPDPLTAMDSIVKTVATLRMGTPAEKANRMAQLIQHYAIDINALDGALATIYGEPPEGEEGQTQTPPTAITEALDARLKPFYDFMSQVQSAQQTAEQEREARTAAEIEEFRGKAEFLDDVRLDMALLLDTAASNERDLTLEQAYDLACRMNPEISAVLAQRETQAVNERTTSRVADKERIAAVSTPAKQTGVTSTVSDGSLRSDIEAAIDAVEGG